MAPGCESCDNEVCKEHSSVQLQMQQLNELPSTVSRLTGIVSVIAGLFALLVGLAFNAHFEQIRQDESMDAKFEVLGVQIEKLSERHEDSKDKLRARLVRIETKIEQSNRGK